jgi:MFS transporter, CP family, cyanate transporter
VTLGVVGLAAISFAPATMPFAAVACCAFGLGGAFTLGMTLPLDNTRSVDEANVWNAFVLTVAYLVATCGPLILGYVRDVIGDFSLSFALLAAVAVGMLSVTPFLRPRREQAYRRSTASEGAWRFNAVERADDGASLLKSRLPDSGGRQAKTKRRRR